MKYRTFRLIRHILFLGIIAAVLFSLLLFLNERQAVDIIKSPPADLSGVLRKEKLNDDDYKLLFYETGLGQSCIDIIWQRQDKKELILSEQKKFYDIPDYDCHILSLLTKSEKIIDKKNTAVFYDLRPGDVLLTKSTHTLFYRHGHSALVLDEDTLLEAVAIGEQARPKLPILSALGLKDLNVGVREPFLATVLGQTRPAPSFFLRLIA